MRKNDIIKFSMLIGILAVALVPQVVGAAPFGQWTTVFGTNCPDYSCWFQQVWIYATAVVVPLSTLMLIYAGILWTTSSGDPEKIGKAKKIITGVVSGILLLVFARIFIINIIGLDGAFWNAPI